MNKKLSIKDAILYAVNAVVSHPWYFLKLFLTWIGFSILFLVIPSLIFALLAITFRSALFVVLFALILYVMGLFVWILPAKLLLRFYDQGPEPFSLSLFLSQFDFGMMLKILGAIILFYLIVGAGLLLLIIPGIYWLIRFSLAFFTIIDTNCGIIEAFRRSYQRTKNNFWRLCGLLIIAGILLNLIITIPISVLMMIHAYRQLNPR